MTGSWKPMIDGRSPGSRHFFAPFTFPLSQWPDKSLKKVLPFTVAGAATVEIPWVRSIFPCSLLFPFWRHPEGEPSIKFIAYLNRSASSLLTFFLKQQNDILPFGFQELMFVIPFKNTTRATFKRNIAGNFLGNMGTKQRERLDETSRSRQGKNKGEKIRGEK